MQRVLVYGVTGSGKSTLAQRVAARTGLPYVAVDDLTWQPGWVQLPTEEQRRLLTEVCAADRWVLDSAYGTWTDVVLARADLVVGLDYPRWVSLGRLLRRTALRVVDRQEVCGGNVETLRQALSDESIVRWHFRSFARKRERIVRWQADPAMPRVLRLTSPRETEAWLAGLSPA